MVATSFNNVYRYSLFLKVGAGVSVLYYLNNKNVRQSANYFSVPIFRNVRGNALPDDTRMTVPFWFVNVGKSISDGFISRHPLNYASEKNVKNLSSVLPTLFVTWIHIWIMSTTTTELC